MCILYSSPNLLPGISVVLLGVSVVLLAINNIIEGRKLRALGKENDVQSKKIRKLELHIMKQLKEQDPKGYIDFLESRLFHVRIDPNVKDPSPLAPPSET